MMKNDDTDYNNSRSRILHLLGFNQSAVAHVITYVYLFLLSPSVVPFATAQPNSISNTEPQYGNFNPSMVIIIIIIVILICAIFFMGLFSFYLRQCSEENNGVSVRNLNNFGERSQRAAMGLDPAVIETFPTFMYSDVKELKLGKRTLECAICLNAFEDDDTLRLLPKCDHVFHPECIDAWLASHTTCPVCRDNLVLVLGSGEDVVISVEQTPDVPEGQLDVGNPRMEASEGQEQNMVDKEQLVAPGPGVINQNPIPIQNRPGRTRSSRGPRMQRFHSTGHLLGQPAGDGENCGSFKLRLSEDARKQIMKRRLNRTTSCVAVPCEGSTQCGSGYGNRCEGSSGGKSYNNQIRGGAERRTKSERWVLSMAPSFFARTFSTRSWKAEPDAGR
ncbi:PREDICTED: E3 ubiquitin-protein ligase ATL6-like [Nelumbo nucifera]|uniref:RING-type E3 ubiquitin transferase n=2 Tax=Nelumbo nucifera TaxID=4432 RepID=A0A1U8B1C7_NELNU|nr:PREDICTED: E3 ubiquitin-protein ligase ATL6-like [Nelumbo nucifera]DAD22043.1 TPA_asm: hypothetical protein HUJ06_023506 [Nelumbo nucifera]